MDGQPAARASSSWRADAGVTRVQRGLSVQLPPMLFIGPVAPTHGASLLGALCSSRLLELAPMGAAQLKSVAIKGHLSGLRVGLLLALQKVGLIEVRWAFPPPFARRAASLHCLCLPNRDMCQQAGHAAVTSGIRLPSSYPSIDAVIDGGLCWPLGLPQNW